MRVDAGVKVIAVAETHDSEVIRNAFQAGAHACVVKTAQPSDVLHAIRQLSAPTVYFAHDILNWQARQEAIERSGLSPRELEILELVASGASNSQVARRLWVTEQTVKLHLNSTYKKLGVSSRTQASHWAHQVNLVKAVDQGDTLPWRSLPEGQSFRQRPPEEKRPG